MTMLSQVRLGISTISRRLTTSSTCHQVPLDRFTEEEEPMRLAAAQMGTMMDIGGRNIFNSDHDMFRSQVRRWMRERLAPLQASFEENGQPTKEIWTEMGNQVEIYIEFYSLSHLRLTVFRECWESQFLLKSEVLEHLSWRRPLWQRRCRTPTVQPRPWQSIPPSVCPTWSTMAPRSSRKGEGLVLILLFK